MNVHLLKTPATCVAKDEKISAAWAFSVSARRFRLRHRFRSPARIRDEAIARRHDHFRQRRPVHDGIGALPGTVRRLTGSVKVPHIGWNEVTVQPRGSGGTDESRSRLLAGIADGTRFYFVHSYAPGAGGEAVAAVCDYGGPFAAAVERGNLFGTQFHPEKSGAAGHALLSNFVALVAEREEAPAAR